jgi:hypothetical protein
MILISKINFSILKNMTEWSDFYLKIFKFDHIEKITQV